MTGLSLHILPVPRHPLLKFISHNIARASSYQCRYFLQGQPIRNGDILEIRICDTWIPGRYEWSSMLFESPKLQTKTHGRLEILDSDQLRWPLPGLKLN